MEHNVRITPEIGKEYENKGGGVYKCMGIDKDISFEHEGAVGNSAIMQNVETGFTLLAHGVNLYDDGKIDWDFSKQLGFEKVGEFHYEWKNYGDVGFAEYGGVLLRQSNTTNRPNDYEYFKLEIDAEGFKYAFSGTLCDLNDYIKEECVQELADEYGKTPQELFNDNPMAMAACVLDNYGHGIVEFSPHNKDGQGQYSMDYNDFRVNNDQLTQFMKDLNIPDEFRPEPVDYTKVFEEALGSLEMDLVKHLDGFGLQDAQGANLANIEAERFDDASEITDRLMGSYINDYYFNDLEDEAEQDVSDFISENCPSTAEEWVQFMDDHPSFLSNHTFEYNVMNMLAHHEDEVDLDAIVERNNAYTYDINDVPKFFAEIITDEHDDGCKSSFYMDSKGTIFEVHAEESHLMDNPVNSTNKTSPKEAIDKIESARSISEDMILIDYTPEMKDKLQGMAKEERKKNEVER